MSVEYVIDRPNDDRDPSPPRAPRTARRGLKERTKPHIGKGFAVRTRDGEYGRRLPWRVARLRVWAIETRGGVGTKVFLKALKDNTVWAITKVSDDPRIVDLGCAPELERIHAFVWKRGGVRSGGRYYCRYVAGTRIVSRHGYRSASWRGSAEDIFVTADTMTQLLALAHYIVGLAEDGEISPATVIVGNQEWTPSGRWHSYGGLYHRHCHVDVDGGFPCSP